MGMMPTHTQPAVVSTSPPQDTLNTGMYLDLGKEHSK